MRHCQIFGPLVSICNSSVSAASTNVQNRWLNIAECELSTLARQCLNRRIPDHGKLEEQTRAWETHRNQGGTAVKWRFSTEDARMKLTHLYPQIS